MKNSYYFFPLLLLSSSVIAQLSAKDEPEEGFHSEKHVTIVTSFDRTGPSFSLPKEGVVVGHLNEQKILEGVSKNSKLNGGWQSWYTTGQLLDSGTLDQGIPDGQWKRWDSSGNLIAVRHYDADKYKRVRQEMKHAHPKRILFPIVRLYQENRSRARYFLKAAYSFNSSALNRQVATLDEAVVHNMNSTTYHPVFEDCLHHGLYMNLFPNGMARDSGYFNNGLREGVWLHRNQPNGSYWMGSYKNGTRQLEWKQYNAAGRLTHIIGFNKKGEEKWRKSF